MQHSIARAFGYWLKGMEFFAPMLMRFTVGWVFFFSGWGKLHHLGKVTEYFVSLGIPYAGLQAPMVSLVEFVFGGALLLGLYTRLAAVPLMGVMVVATLTAKQDSLGAIGDLLETSEYLYFVILAALAFYGGGKISVDHFLKRKP